MNFECHITVAAGDGDVAARVAEEAIRPWKVSRIDGDPLLGQQVFVYLTMHDTSYVRMYRDMNWTAARLAQEGAAVLRQKIELIMYDTKTGVGQ